MTAERLAGLERRVFGATTDSWGLLFIRTESRNALRHREVTLLPNLVIRSSNHWTGRQQRSLTARGNT